MGFDASCMGGSGGLLNMSLQQNREQLQIKLQDLGRPADPGLQHQITKQFLDMLGKSAIAAMDRLEHDLGIPDAEVAFAILFHELRARRQALLSLDRFIISTKSNGKVDGELS